LCKKKERRDSLREDGKDMVKKYVEKIFSGIMDFFSLGLRMFYDIITLYIGEENRHGSGKPHPVG